MTGILLTRVRNTDPGAATTRCGTRTLSGSTYRRNTRAAWCGQPGIVFIASLYFHNRARATSATSLASQIGAQAKFFTLDPSTETGRASWIAAIAGDDVTDSAAAGGELSAAVDVTWLPRNRRPRTAGEAGEG